jgi:transposase-like protein
VERDGRVLARVMPDATKETILPIVGEVLHPHAMIYTDGSATLDAGSLDGAESPPQGRQPLQGIR